MVQSQIRDAQPFRLEESTGGENQTNPSLNLIDLSGPNSGSTDIPSAMRDTNPSVMTGVLSFNGREVYPSSGSGTTDAVPSPMQAQGDFSSYPEGSGSGGMKENQSNRPEGHHHNDHGHGGHGGGGHGDGHGGGHGGGHNHQEAAVHSLNTGDTLIQSPGTETLVTPNGSALVVNKDGSYTLKGGENAKAAQGDDGSTTLNFDNGDTVRMAGGHITDIKRGTTTEHIRTQPHGGEGHHHHGGHGKQAEAAPQPQDSREPVTHVIPQDESDPEFGYAD